ncbi:aminotransferase family protein [Deinococcus puniceus]|uniref:Aminotransferase class III n=1 Tax=Deinococcus puniceus TaxID=1182568 RepID=A0A172TAH6_9DEIO|nr:aminotransferase class III-fold pyridoxal phosphate-dependent enzyme [Deinococcus puniceus]ANE43962.1 aminotransferase class III [Deinococcus puniceus]
MTQTAPTPADQPIQSTTSSVFYRSSKAYPVAVRGEGVYLYDSDGKRYLDGSSGALVANIGHGRAEVGEAMAAQARTLAFVHGSQFTSPVLEEYTARLAAFLDLPNYRFWAVSGGSEATESAIKLARQYHAERGDTARFKIVTRIPSYHGASLGALAASGMGARRSLYLPLMREDAWPKMPKPDPALSGEADAERLRAVLEAAGPESVAAVMVEPVVGASDAALSPGAGYHTRLHAICKEYGVLLIADEVMSGMGRCGVPLAVRLTDPVTPDIVVLGKGLAAGYAPLAGLMASAEIYDTVMGGSGAFKHGFTYAGHPVSVAAGLSVLDIVEREGLVAKAQERGAHLLAGLRELKAKYAQVLEVRGQGLLLGMVLGNPATGEAYPTPGLAERVAAAARARGLITYPGSGALDSVRGDHLLLGPPLSISAAEVEEMLAALDGALGESSTG